MKREKYPVLYLIAASCFCISSVIGFCSSNIVLGYSNAACAVIYFCLAFLQRKKQDETEDK